MLTVVNSDLCNESVGASGIITVWLKRVCACANDSLRWAPPHIVSWGLSTNACECAVVRAILYSSSPCMSRITIGFIALWILHGFCSTAKKLKNGCKSCTSTSTRRCQTKCIGVCRTSTSNCTSTTTTTTSGRSQTGYSNVCYTILKRNAKQSQFFCVTLKI